MRDHATTGLAIAASFTSDRALGFDRCRAAIKSPFIEISTSGSLSLTVQAARAGLHKELRFALDAAFEILPMGGIDTTARLLSNYWYDSYAPRVNPIKRTLQRAGNRGEAVYMRLSELVTGC
jgi:hypothetical protein